MELSMFNLMKDTQIKIRKILSKETVGV